MTGGISSKEGMNRQFTLLLLLLLLEEVRVIDALSGLLLLRIVNAAGATTSDLP